MTIAVVAFSFENLIKIHNQEILPELNDSKKLNPIIRNKLFPSIKNHSLFYSIVHISPQRIDLWGIQEAIFYGIYKAMKRYKTIPTFLIMDGNYNWKNCKNIHSSCHPKSISIVKGDEKVLSIQAASILAKVSRDQIMLQYAKKFPGYGFENHKGYGTIEHRKAIQKLGPTPIHRRTFIRNII